MAARSTTDIATRIELGAPARPQAPVRAAPNDDASCVIAAAEAGAVAVPDQIGSSEEL